VKAGWHFASSRASWGGALAVCLLAGCASVGERSNTPILSGRLSVHVEGSGEAARNLSAHFELAGDAQQGSLSLSTPLGTMMAQARWAPQQALLATPQGQTSYPNMQTLMHDLLGVAIPLDALIAWLHGRPWLGATSRPTPAPGEAGFRQLGWQIMLARFDQGWVTARRLQTPVVLVRAQVDKP